VPWRGPLDRGHNASDSAVSSDRTAPRRALCLGDVQHPGIRPPRAALAPKRNLPSHSSRASSIFRNHEAAIPICPEPINISVDESAAEATVNLVPRLSRRAIYLGPDAFPREFPGCRCRTSAVCFVPDVCGLRNCRKRRPPSTFSCSRDESFLLTGSCAGANSYSSTCHRWNSQHSYIYLLAGPMRLRHA
jgi:hypothetical protein